MSTTKERRSGGDEKTVETVRDRYGRIASGQSSTCCGGDVVTTVDAEKLGQDYVFELRQQLFAHISRLSPRSLQRRSQGGTMLRFIGDMNALRQWISLGIARLAVAAVTTILVPMCANHW